jgi:predicted outer membrane repeat protein
MDAETAWLAANMSFNNLSFVNNIAGGSGGAVYIDRMSTTGLQGQANSFSNNMVRSASSHEHGTSICGGKACAAAGDFFKRVLHCNCTCFQIELARDLRAEPQHF